LRGEKSWLIRGSEMDGARNDGGGGRGELGKG